MTSPLALPQLWELLRCAETGALRIRCSCDKTRDKRLCESLCRSAANMRC